MRTFVFTCLLLLGMTTFAQDANFHIYLCLGTIEHGRKCKGRRTGYSGS